MIGFLVRAALRMLMLAGVLYVTFFVPLGPRTLYGHMARISATPEAHELVAAVSTQAKETARAFASRIGALKTDPAR
jgi:hypothetical protein